MSTTGQRSAAGWASDLVKVASVAEEEIKAGRLEDALATLLDARSCLDSTETWVAEAMRERA